MNVYVDYPEDWIGVPQFGPAEQFPDAAQWAAALADELLVEFGVRAAREERASLVSALTILGEGTRRRGATASYIHYPSYGAPLELVDTVLLDRSVVGDAPAHEVAGALEPDLLAAPTVTPLTTRRGLTGALVVRHAPMDAEAPHIVTLRASCALDVGDGWFVLGTATTDLPAFEAFRAHFLELADSVYVTAD
ncbi:hypothetical protein [Microbacterium ulmi]|uniref:Uncharacterized protein n=1 Tax=Microbacterium ulmi TaxID=179095 RepID=A0A7Y2M1B7_9MICO|nr:hypothetical protein [Microbacterium ulmi]NII70106.1 hypothetical protein [Microbacterium ulmi]NNH04352.1 hypothetical protein [Microbacterium ulmi]